MTITVLALVIRLTSSTASSAINQTVLEIIPTPFRGQGYGFVNTTGHLATFFSPMIIYLVYYMHIFLNKYQPFYKMLKIIFSEYFLLNTSLFDFGGNFFNWRDHLPLSTGNNHEAFTRFNHRSGTFGTGPIILLYTMHSQVCQLFFSLIKSKAMMSYLF